MVSMSIFLSMAGWKPRSKEECGIQFYSISTGRLRIPAQYALEKEFGMQVPLADLRCFVGPPLKEQFMSFAGVSEEEAVRAVERYRERYRPKGIYENYLYDGIKGVIRQLHEEHFTLALTSSKPTEFCRQILRMFNIDEYFTAVVGSDMDGRPNWACRIFAMRS